MPVTISCPGLQGCKKCLPKVFMINPLEVLSYSQVSGTCQQSMFKACTRCCYATFAEILNGMAFLGPGQREPGALTTAAQPTRVGRCLCTRGSQCPWVSPPVPASQPSGTAAVPRPGRGCPEPAEGPGTAGGRTGTGQGTAAMSRPFQDSPWVWGEPFC